jgi:hypothetical protein
MCKILVKMKIQSQFLILFILLFNSISIYGQMLKPNLKIRANKVFFITTELDHNRMSVVNDRNIYHNKILKNRNPDMTFKIKEKSGLLNAFTQVFSDERLRQLQPERRMLMTFYINPAGQIVEISFVLNKNTLITARELEELEGAIKANVSIKFRPEDVKGKEVIDIGYIITFSQVLDRTLGS